MKKSKIIIGGVTGAVSFFFLGWLIYGILLSNFTKNNYNQCAMIPMEEMRWWAMILSDFAYGFLLSVFISFSKSKSFIEKVILCGMIGLLISINMDLSSYSMSNMFYNFKAVLIDIFVFTVMSAIGGVFIALVMGQGNKES
jgi:hypothetical protein